MNHEFLLHVRIITVGIATFHAYKLHMRNCMMNHDRHMTFDPSSKIHSKPSSTRRRPWSSSWCGTARASRNPKTGSWNRSSKVWMLIPMTTASPVTPRKRSVSMEKMERRISAIPAVTSHRIPHPAVVTRHICFWLWRWIFLNMFDMFLVYDTSIHQFLIHTISSWSILADCIGCIFNVCFFRTSPNCSEEEEEE